MNDNARLNVNGVDSTKCASPGVALQTLLVRFGIIHSLLDVELE